MRRFSRMSLVRKLPARILKPCKAIQIRRRWNVRKLSQTLPLLCVLLVSSACNKVPIKNVPLYWPAGPDGAVITHTLTDEEGKLSKPEWDEFSRGTVCMTYDDFGWLRGTVEKLCSEHKMLCKSEVEAKLARFNARARRTEARLSRRQSI